MTWRERRRAARRLSGEIGITCCSGVGKRSPRWLFALFWPLYALVTNLFILAGVTALLALADPIYDITQFSYRAARIPDELQGRVHSAYRLIALATPPLGLALTGLLLQRVGVLPTLLVFAIALLGLAVLATVNKSVRRV